MSDDRFRNDITGETLKAALLKAGERHRELQYAVEKLSSAEAFWRLANDAWGESRMDFSELLSKASPKAVDELDRLMGYPFGSIWNTMFRTS